MSEELIAKIIKFFIVGFSGMIVDFGATYICKEKFKLQKYLSNSIGFTLAVISNYYLNRIWTFQSHDPEVAMQFFKFFVISIVGLGINNGVIYILHDKLKQNFYLSKIFAVFVVASWNFVMNYLFTFS